MPDEAKDTPQEPGKNPAKGLFQFSPDVVREMADFLSKDLKRPATDAEAKEALFNLARYVKFIYDNKDELNDTALEDGGKAETP